MLLWCYCVQPQHGWGTKQLEICTVLENGKGMSGAELENLFHLGHARKARQQMELIMLSMRTSVRLCWPSARPSHKVLTCQVFLQLCEVG